MKAVAHGEICEAAVERWLAGCTPPGDGAGAWGREEARTGEVADAVREAFVAAACGDAPGGTLGVQARKDADEAVDTALGRWSLDPAGVRDMAQAIAEAKAQGRSAPAEQLERMLGEALPPLVLEDAAAQVREAEGRRGSAEAREKLADAQDSLRGTRPVQLRWRSARLAVAAADAELGEGAPELVARCAATGQAMERCADEVEQLERMLQSVADTG